MEVVNWLGAGFIPVQCFGTLVSTRRFAGNTCHYYTSGSSAVPMITVHEECSSVDIARRWKWGIGWVHVI
ncbi:hypothetical protein HHK36_023273 [Tetracentron sinense]|uniref:Uncharacterized protein n=1 Tax=Tetracentron sinense TaxID=13715 RepID=A0A835D593_TETSI|nr:hypothetical protein HHK36_023273 [Tetracentron sinense]